MGMAARFCNIINNSVNFIIYYYAGKQFRPCFLLCIRKDKIRIINASGKAGNIMKQRRIRLQTKSVPSKYFLNINKNKSFRDRNPIVFIQDSSEDMFKIWCKVKFYFLRNSEKTSLIGETSGRHSRMWQRAYKFFDCTLNIA